MSSIAWIVATFIVAVLGVECAARAWLRWGAATYIRRPNERIVLNVDREILPELSAQTRFTTNRFGARGDTKRSQGRGLRIVACGGSAVECLSLDDSEAWPAVTEAVLNRPDHLKCLGAEWVEMQNIGQSGFTTRSLFYALPRVLPQFGTVDVVVIMIGASALNSWTEIGTPSTLPPPPITPWAAINWHNEYKYGWSPKKSALYSLAVRLYRSLTINNVEFSGVGRGIARSRSYRANAREMRETYGDPKEWLQDFEETLIMAIQQAKSLTRRVIVMQQPLYRSQSPSAHDMAMFWHGFVAPPEGGVPTIFYSHTAICEMMQLVEKATERACVQAGVDLLNTSDAIEPSPSMFYDHFHLTPAGAQRLGQLLAAHLLEQLSPSA